MTQRIAPCESVGGAVGAKIGPFFDRLGPHRDFAGRHPVPFRAVRGQRAFYYARVLENSACRWSREDALRAGVPPREDLTKTIQLKPVNPLSQEQNI